MCILSNCLSQMNVLTGLRGTPGQIRNAAPNVVQTPLSVFLHVLGKKEPKLHEMLLETHGRPRQTRVVGATNCVGWRCGLKKGIQVEHTLSCCVVFMCHVHGAKRLQGWYLHVSPLTWRTVNSMRWHSDIWWPGELISMSPGCNPGCGGRCDAKKMVS